jgi:hypothetical protein
MWYLLASSPSFKISPDLISPEMMAVFFIYNRFFCRIAHFSIGKQLIMKSDSSNIFKFSSMDSMRQIPYRIDIFTNSNF